MPRDLCRGSTGEDVAALQKALNYRMAPTRDRLVPDRDFGSLTEAAVKEYQALHHLKPDGIVGRNTRSALNTGLLLLKGTLYRTGPDRPVPILAASGKSHLLFAQAISPIPGQTQPAPPPAPPITTAFQLQPGLTLVLPPWIFPPGQPQPGAVLQKTLQFSVVFKQGDGQGHLEFSPFVQTSANSQSGPDDPKVSFTGGYQVVAADLIAPWKLPLLKGWVFHPLSLVWQTALVFNAKPAGSTFGTTWGAQVQLDAGSDRFSIVIGGAVGPSMDLNKATVTVGAQGMVGGVVQF